MIEPIWKAYIQTTLEPILTPQQCDEFIKIGQNEPKIKGTLQGKDIKYEYRQSSISWIPFTKALTLYKPIHELIGRININSFGFDNIHSTEDGQYAEYSKGDFYNWHMDSGVEMKDMPIVRKISMTLLLSDPKDYEGGYLQIFGGNFFDSKKSKIIIKRGHAVFFASFLLHRVTPITKGNRKSLVMWFGGSPLK